MIAIARGTEVRRLLAEVQRNPGRSTQITICSPFVDPDLVPLVVELAERAHRARCGLRLFTRPPAATMLLQALPGPAARWKDILMIHPRLHAKTYLRLDREGRSEVIITSANLTMAGLDANVELGVHASSTSVIGRQLVAGVRHFLEHLARHEARSSSSYPHE